MKILVSLLGCALLLGAADVGSKLKLDKSVTCKVTQKPLYQHPEWVALSKMEDGKIYYFSSFKTMMRYFFGISPEEQQSVKERYVVDYATLDMIDATKAYYVYGSHVVSSVGDDLIPFASKAEAEQFMQKNGGSRIMAYDQINKGLIDLLNMNF